LPVVLQPVPGVATVVAPVGPGAPSPTSAPGAELETLVELKPRVEATYVTQPGLRPIRVRRRLSPLVLASIVGAVVAVLADGAFAFIGGGSHAQPKAIAPVPTPTSKEH